MPDLTVAYRDLGLGELRPFLVLTVTGPGGAKGAIAGLIDSGADGTVLPAGYASLMGYMAADLIAEQGTQVGGSVTMWQATSRRKPSSQRSPVTSSTSTRVLSTAARPRSGDAKTCCTTSTCTSWSAESSSRLRRSNSAAALPSIDDDGRASANAADPPQEGQTDDDSSFDSRGLRSARQEGCRSSSS